MLFCQNQLCIYWKHYSCVLPDNAMDKQGNCIDCTTIAFDKNFLDTKRSEALQKNSQAYLGGAVKRGRTSK